MERICILFICISGFCYKATSQTSTYDLFAQPGIRQGIVNLYDPDVVKNASIYYSGDSIINGTRYISYSYFYGVHYRLWFIIDGYKVYKANPDYNDNLLLYDFGVEKGDTIREGFYQNMVVSEKGIRIYNDGKNRIYYTLKGWGTHVEIVEGIGELRYSILRPFVFHDGSYTFLCLHDENQLIYEQENVPGDCDTMFCKKSNAYFIFEKKGNKVEFFDKSVHAFAWLWDFGDGHFSTEKNPVFSFDSPGCKEVKLTTTGDCGSVSNRTYFIEYCQTGGWESTGKISTYARDYNFINEITWWLTIGLDSIHFTNDGGNTYVKLKIAEAVNLPGKKFRFVDLRVHKEILFIYLKDQSSINYVILSKDGGLNWQQIASSKFYSQLFTDENGKVLHEDSKNIYVSGNFGHSWDTIIKPSAFYIFNAFFQNNGDILLVFYFNNQNGIFTTTIKGQFISSEFTELPSHYYSYKINDNLFYIIDNDKNIFKSTDNFKSFFYVADLNDVSLYLHPLFVTENEWYIYNDNEVYYTYDGGQSFQKRFCEFIGIRGMYKDNNKSVYLIERFISENWINNYNALTTSEECSDLTGMDEESSEKELFLFPNPAYDKLQIHYSTEVINYDIYSSSGSLVKSGRNQTTGMILIEDLPSGLYFIHINATNLLGKFHKFIKL